MDAERVRRLFLSLVLVAAALLAVLEVRLARTGDPAAAPAAPWLTPIADTDRALASGDLASAAASRHRAYLAALGSRSWEGFVAVGDAALRLGEASGDRHAMEPEARRAYRAALSRARAERSLDGVLRATESLARLGDRDDVEQGLRLGRDLAGNDREAQARVATVAGRWFGEAL